MSSRVTRSATKLAAESSSAAANPANTSAATHPLPKSCKRKAHPDPDPNLDNLADTNNPIPPRQAKKQKVVPEASSTPTPPKSRRRSGKRAVTMAKPGYVRFDTGQENPAHIGQSLVGQHGRDGEISTHKARHIEAKIESK